MNITITAHRWSRGWELHHQGVPITQAKKLHAAADQVRSYFDTVEPGIDHSDWQIDVRAELGELSTEVADARAATSAASSAAETAARQSRDVVRHLREVGISVADAAEILGVSRGRVSQLANS